MPDATAEIWASHRGGIPVTIEISIYTVNLEAAHKVAARFPASAGVRATTITHYPDQGGKPVTHGLVHSRIKVSADGRTRGAVNETGIRRYRAIRKVVDQIGIPVEYVTPFRNCFPNEAALQAAIR